MLNLDNPEPWVYEPAPDDPRRDAHALLVEYVNETLATPPPDHFGEISLEGMEPTKRRVWGSAKPSSYEMGRALLAADEALRRDLVLAALEQDLAMQRAGYDYAPLGLLLKLVKFDLLGQEGTQLREKDLVTALQIIARDGPKHRHGPSNWFKMVLDWLGAGDVELEHVEVQEALQALAHSPLGRLGSQHGYTRLWELQAEPFRLHPHEEWARRLWADYIDATADGRALWRDILAHAKSVRPTPSRKWLGEAKALLGRVEGEPFARRFSRWLKGYVARSDERPFDNPALSGLTWMAVAAASPPVDAIAEVALGGYTKVIYVENECGIQQQWRSEATGSAGLRALAHLGEVERLRHLKKAIPHKRAKRLIDKLVADA